MTRAIWSFIAVWAVCVVVAQAYSPKITAIIDRARQDGIDLPALPFADAAFTSIDNISNALNGSSLASLNGSRVDVHAHVVPDFYRVLAPVVGGRPSPTWDIATQFQFMASHSIAHSVLSISSPGSVVFLGNETLSVGLARVLNEWLVELCRTFPDRFSFYAVTPLPYVNAAITEANYARNELGAVGLGVLSNHEGLYLGNTALAPFFTAVDAGSASTSVFVHPTTPYMNLNGTLVVANPTLYGFGLVEFYFETARTMMDLTLTQTFANLTNIRWHFPHCAGAFPSIEDRALRLTPAIQTEAQKVYNSRVWYDSAGATYFAQVKGLLAYGVPKSQLVFGSDFPFAPGTYELSMQAVDEADFLSERERMALYSENYQAFLSAQVPSPART